MFQTRCGHEVLNNLVPQKRYVVVLHSYTIVDGEDLVLGYSNTTRIRTKSGVFPPPPVRNFTLVNYQVVDNDLQVSIQWEHSIGK